MFDIGFSELLLFGVIALIVLGPEKLPQAARTAGQWYAKIRRTVSTLQSEIEAELDLAETRQQMQKELAKIRQTEADMKREIAEMRGNMKAFEDSHTPAAATSGSTTNNESRKDVTECDKKPDSTAMPKAFDYSYTTDSHATDAHEDTAKDNQLSKRDHSDADSDVVDNDNMAQAAQSFTTRPWENMWFRLGAYDKARRLPMPPYLPNYKADTLLNSSVSTQTSDNKQGTD